MTETNFVILNSKFRSVSSKSSSDFTYSLGETLEVNNIAIKSVSIPNVEYNVKEGKNKLIVNNGAVDVTLTFTVGQYDITSLLAELVTQLTTIYGGTNTAVLDPITKKVKVTTTTAIKFSTDPTSSPLGYIFGFGNSAFDYYPEIANTTINALYFPNLQGANNYHISSSTLGQGQGSLLKNNDKRPIILSIPVDVDFGEIINYEVNEIKLNQRHFSRPANIQEIDIKIIDDDNEIVDLGNTDIEIILQIIKAPVLPFSLQGSSLAHY
jgi:hypothetical protein